MIRIKEVAKQKGVSINELADKLGISRITLHAQMNGNPTIETLGKIATALEVPITDLFEQPKTNVFHCPKCGTELELKEK